VSNSFTWNIFSFVNDVRLRVVCICSPSLMRTWTLITQYACYLQRYAQQQHIDRHPGVFEMSKCLSIVNNYHPNQD
jgi:hypothetical protein